MNIVSCGISLFHLSRENETSECGFLVLCTALDASVKLGSLVPFVMVVSFAEHIILVHVIPLRYLWFPFQKHYV